MSDFSRQVEQDDLNDHAEAMERLKKRLLREIAEMKVFTTLQCVDFVAAEVKLREEQLERLGYKCA